MQADEIHRIIHAAHEMRAPHYGELDLHGRVTPNTLEHWSYDRLVRTPIRRIVRATLGARPFVMLDAGCGNGRLFHVYRELGAQRIFGVDFSASMLREAQQRAAANGIPFFPLRARLEELGCLPAGRFDLINLYGVIEHLPEPLPVLRLLARLVAPGGVLVVPVPRWGSLCWLTYVLFVESMEKDVIDETWPERLLRRRKMRLYTFYRRCQVERMIDTLRGMRLTVRLPVAHGGVVGPPNRILRRCAETGNYAALDRWNRVARCLRLIPAGEYLAFRKRKD